MSNVRTAENYFSIGIKQFKELLKIGKTVRFPYTFMVISATGLVVRFVKGEPLSYFFMVELMQFGNAENVQIWFIVASKKQKAIFGRGMTKLKRSLGNWIRIIGRMDFLICVHLRISYSLISLRICIGVSMKRSERNF